MFSVPGREMGKLPTKENSISVEIRTQRTKINSFDSCLTSELTQTIPFAQLHYFQRNGNSICPQLSRS